MNKPTSLLAVLDRGNTDRALLGKAAKLARRFNARLETSKLVETVNCDLVLAMAATAVDVAGQVSGFANATPIEYAPCMHHGEYVLKSCPRAS